METALYCPGHDLHQGQTVLSVLKPRGRAARVGRARALPGDERGGLRLDVGARERRDLSSQLKLERDEPHDAELPGLDLEPVVGVVDVASERALRN